MTVFIGIVLFVFSLLFTALKPKSLIYLLAFFIPFSSTAVIGVGEKNFSLPFSILLMAITVGITKSIIKLGISWRKENGWINNYMLLIATVLIISGFMPWIISGKIQVLDKYSDLLTYAKLIPLYPKMQYITQLIYTIAGIWIVYFVADKIKDFDDWKRVIKVLIGSLAFVSIWGLFEFLTFFIGIRYPSEIFSNLGLNSNGINILNEMPRISSVTLEPSAFAQSYSLIIPIMLWGIKYNEVFFTPLKDKLLITLFLVTIILCNSSTAYILLVFWVILYFWDLIIRKKKFYLKLIFVFIGIALMVALVPVIIEYSINKLNDYSGLERTLAVVSGIEYFLEYPFWGVGWGVFHVWDFVINLLCGAGIIGLIVFFLFFNRIRKELSGLNNVKVNLKTPIIYASVSLFLAVQSSGFLYYAQYVWFYIGLIVSFIVVSKKSKNV